MRIEYIGLKAVKSDNIAGTGVDWHGAGDVHEIPDDKAAKLLAYPQIWRQAGEQLASAGLSTAAPVLTLAEQGILLGSNALQALVDIGGIEFQVGSIVRGAQEASGLTAAEWNDLSEDDRDAVIDAHVKALQQAAPMVEQTAAASPTPAPAPALSPAPAPAPAPAAKAKGKAKAGK